ncbi:hypothetical protein QR685DRAFT_104980 [Neurospora intermedia]|uniref:Uncharacterized protein n=1 Tax=Neurospora intermedia TaxID=5142 RepID=A0ABR3D244_NEUIN
MPVSPSFPHSHSGLSELRLGTCCASASVLHPFVCLSVCLSVCLDHSLSGFSPLLPYPPTPSAPFPITSLPCLSGGCSLVAAVLQRAGVPNRNPSVRTSCARATSPTPPQPHTVTCFCFCFLPCLASQVLFSDPIGFFHTLLGFLLIPLSSSFAS